MNLTFPPATCYQDRNLSGGRQEINLRICTLASGSKGNCVYVEGGKTKVLIDAGLTLRETRLRLAEIGVKAEEITAVLITHEHADHIKGLGPLGRACHMPLYLTPKTRAAANPWLGKGLNIHEFEPGEAFEIDDLYFEPFSTSHDAVDSVGFAFHCGRHKAGLATDLGYASHLVIERLRGVNLLVLESNHDPKMLKDGPYPWHLKQRVSGKEGHLSNEDAGRLMEELIHDGLSQIILAHLSQINNLPEIAYDKARDMLESKSCGHIRLEVAGQNNISGFAELKG